jgi:hypothetical protein
MAPHSANGRLGMVKLADEFSGERRVLAVDHYAQRRVPQRPA